MRLKKGIRPKKKKGVHIRLEEELVKRIKLAAKEQGITATQVFEEALKSYLYKKPPRAAEALEAIRSELSGLSEALQDLCKFLKDLSSQPQAQAGSGNGV